MKQTEESKGAELREGSMPRKKPVRHMKKSLYLTIDILTFPTVRRTLCSKEEMDEIEMFNRTQGMVDISHDKK